MVAISVYKAFERIADTDTICGCPYYWKGMRHVMDLSKRHREDIEKAKTIIRFTFSPPIPHWLIFGNIFVERLQKKEPTDRFVCENRLLFSQLISVTEEVQLRMIYGLLNLNIRERVKRGCVKKVEELIISSREAEICLIEQ